VQVEEIIMHGPLRLISLLPLSEPRKQQRRNSYRLRIGLSALIRPHDGSAFAADPFFADENLTPWEEVLTNNLSETGVSFNSIVQHKIGVCLHIKLTLYHAPDHVEQIELLGIVRQVQTIEYLGTQYRLGVEFLPCSENLRRLIARFVLKKQHQIIRTELEFDSFN
jgi:c-di-GMP-binding flagellar brake protein YcgR